METNLGGLNAATPWRRCQRRFREGGGEAVRQRQNLKLRGRDKNKIFRDRRVFKLLNLRGKIGFLLGFFGGRDGFAQRTGMFAIESI